MSLQTWFEKGLTKEQYMETLAKHKEGFHHIFNNFTLPNDETFTLALKNKNVRAVILAEPWCGHCMLNIPILLNIADKAELPVKFLLRDDNLELMDQYLTNGKSRTIPIMIFIDENGQQVAKWGPIAPTTKQFMDPYRADLPAKDAEDYDDKFKEMITATAQAFQTDEKLWNDVYESMKETLSTI